MKPRKHTPSWYRKKCVARAKEVSKERDNWTCQYCGVSKSQGYQIHSSHILPEGAYPLMSAEPDNMISLCATHHLSGANPRMGMKEPSWHGDPLIFAEFFHKKWPGRYKELIDMANEKLKHVVNWKSHYESINEKVL